MRGQTDNNQLKIAQGIVSGVIYGERNSSTPSLRKCQYSTGLERCQLYFPSNNSATHPMSNSYSLAVWGTPVAGSQPIIS